MPSTACCAFDPKGGNQRPALVLANGLLIVAVGVPHEDIRPYHGWINGTTTRVL